MMPSTSRNKNLTDRAKWNAIERRDRRVDGRFVYAVRTTGIYCRPSCPSRKPRRENVTFFDSGEAAQKAGYRACRKCGGTPIALPRAVEAACRLLESEDEPVTLAKLARRVGVSSAHLHRLFTRSVGVTPTAYASAIRERRLQEHLIEGRSATDAITAAGYRSSSSVYQAASKVLGMTPKQYKNGAAGTRIRYSLTHCSLGWLLVAATDRGVCFTSLGDEPGELENRLRRRFSSAELIDDDRQLSDWISTLVEAIESPGSKCDLPLDIQGTAFQRRVWQALRDIPPGKTSTYAEVARKIGHPKAVRAVGLACGSNPVAPVVPCHRVLRSDGSLGGYGWGLERKRVLLDREKSR